MHGECVAGHKPRSHWMLTSSGLCIQRRSFTASKKSCCSHYLHQQHTAPVFHPRRRCNGAAASLITSPLRLDTRAGLDSLPGRLKYFIVNFCNKRMAHEEPGAPLLLQIPDPCLLLVLQSLADDPASLCSAARAHSRVHQAAVLTLSSISANITSQEQIDDSLVPYLSKHGQSICSMRLDSGWGVFLRQLPVAVMVQLNSLNLRSCDLQLQAGGGFQGLLGAACLPLKQLRLEDCFLLGHDLKLDGWERLGAALSLLPDLEHLGVYKLRAKAGSCFGTEVLQRLQQLTYVEVVQCPPFQARSVLQSLQPLTRLAHLRISVPDGYDSGNHASWVNATTLPSSQLTHMELPLASLFEPDVLAGNTGLQHIDLQHCYILRASEVPQLLLFELQRLQQLTHLNLRSKIQWDVDNEGNPPAAAAVFSALTASCKLRHLDISRCKLPTGAWQHMFPANRQLQHLQSLDISGVTLVPWLGELPAAPESSSLVRCCPGLQCLRMSGLNCGTKQLVTLSGLTGLLTLHVALDFTGFEFDDSSATPAWDCSQLTGLRELDLDSFIDSYADSVGLLLPLTQLRQVTRLDFIAVEWDLSQFECQNPSPNRFDRYSHGIKECKLQQFGPDDEPVWRQLLHHYLKHPKPEVAREAAKGFDNSGF